MISKINSKRKLPLVVEHSTEQCQNCLFVKYSAFGEFRYCDVILPYAEKTMCLACLADIALTEINEGR